MKSSCSAVPTPKTQSVDDDAEVDQKDHIDIIIMNFEKVKVAVNMTSNYINPLKKD